MKLRFCRSDATPRLSKTRRDQRRHFFSNILVSMPTSLLAILITRRSILRARLDLQVLALRLASLADSTRQCQNSRYKDGTTKTCSLAFSPVPYRALQSDR